MKSKNDRVIAVIGYRGSGKSTYIKQHLDEWEPFIIVDPLEDDLYNNNILRVQNEDEFINAIEHNYTRIKVNVNNDGLEWIIETLMAYGKYANKPYTLIIDETDLFAENNYIPLWLKRACNYGRHANMSIVFVARRVVGFQPHIRSQIKEWLVFPNSEREYKQIGEIMGKKLDNLNLNRDNNGVEYLIVTDKMIEKRKMNYEKS